MKHNLKRALAAIALAMFMMLSWQTPARASGSVGSISATGIRITYQNPGYTAHGLPLYGGNKYRVCIGSLIAGETCTNGNAQSLDYYGVVAGTTYRIVVWCGCKGSGPFAVPIPIRLMDVQYTHSEPAPPPPPRIVRIRSAKTGLCLRNTSPNNVLVSDVCGPNPAMQFAIEPSLATGTGGTQMRHVMTGTCIHGSFPAPYPLVILTTCGRYGTTMWIMDYKNGTYRLSIGSTEDNIAGHPPVRGPAGCVRPAPVIGGSATKTQCMWEPWKLEDMVYLDPA